MMRMMNHSGTRDTAEACQALAECLRPVPHPSSIVVGTDHPWTWQGAVALLLKMGSPWEKCESLSDRAFSTCT